MSVYAKQIDFLLNGYRDPTTDVILAGGKVTTKLAGTSTESALWTDRNKGGSATNPIILGSDGTAEVYGDGIYDFVITDSADNPVDTISGIEYIVEVTDADTLSDLQGSAGSFDGETVYLKGRDSTGDGGQGHFYWDSSDLSTPVAADGQSGVYVAPTSDATGSSGAWVRFGFDEYESPWFGDKGDDSNDDYVPLQGAVDFLDSLLPLANTLYVPSGIHSLSQTWQLPTSGLHIRCEGGNYFFGSTDQTKGTVFKWNGDASNMARVSPNTLGSPVIAPRISNASFDGQGVALSGLRVEATVQGVFERISSRNCVTAGVQTGVTGLAGYTGLNFVHSCTFDNLWLDQALSGDGAGLQLSGDADGTTTTSRFSGIHVHHLDGIGLDIIRGDSNYFENIQVGRSAIGTGIGIELKSVASGKSVNSNVFNEVVSGRGGITSRAGAVNAAGNIIFGLGIDTDNPLPTVETNSTLNYFINFDTVDNDRTLSQRMLILAGDFATPVRIRGTHATGIDFNEGTFSESMMRLKNNALITARDFADGINIEVGRVSTSDEWQYAMDVRMSDSKSLNFSTTTGSNICDTVTQKMAFWAATPVVQQANIPDTTGNNAAQNEAEINLLKALIRTLGLTAAS